MKHIKLYENFADKKSDLTFGELNTGDMIEQVHQHKKTLWLVVKVGTDYVDVSARHDGSGPLERLDSLQDCRRFEKNQK